MYHHRMSDGDDSVTISSLPADEVLTGSGYSGGCSASSYESDRRRSLQLNYNTETSLVSNVDAQVESTSFKFPLTLEVFKICTKAHKSADAPKKVVKRQAFKRGSMEERISVSGNYISPPVEVLNFAGRTGKFRTAAENPHVSAQSHKATSSRQPRLIPQK